MHIKIVKRKVSAKNILCHCRCPANPELSVVIELQTASTPKSDSKFSALNFTTEAWTKFDLFDQQGQVVSGRWRLPLKIIPIEPYLSSSDSSFNNLSQVL